METRTAIDCRPTVIIPRKVYQKVMFFVDISPIEISLMAKYKIEDGNFLIVDAFLPKQVNSSTETEMDATDLGAMHFKTREVEGYLNCWIHSHVNMGVFWSGQDWKQIQELGGEGFVLSLVFNKKREVKASWYQAATETHPRLFMDDLTVNIREHWLVDNADLKKQYEEKCSKKVYTPVTTGGKYGKGKPSTHTTTTNRVGGKSGSHNSLNASLFHAGIPCDGDICKEHPNLRWNKKESAWVSYRTYKTEVVADTRYMDNALDHGCAGISRAVFIKKYYDYIDEESQGYVGYDGYIDDLDVEQAFMDIYGLDFDNMYHEFKKLKNLKPVEGFDDTVTAITSK